MKVIEQQDNGVNVERMALFDGVERLAEPLNRLFGFEEVLVVR